MNTAFPRIITLLRKERGLSQKQAAADLEISQALLSHYEKGIRECGLDFLTHTANYYGVSTDYSHIKHIYSEGAERDSFKEKIRCCANEFVRYTHEVRPDVVHASLTDAMACFGIEWEGVAHSSIADTFGCRKVWEALFPNYYCN
jgi:transcriptional regulator with XRE-family HTH domain